LPSSLLDERTDTGLNPRQRQAARGTQVSSYATRLGRAGRGFLGFAILALIWELVPRLGLVDSYFLPPLHTVLSAWWEMVQNGEL
jgi:NitT/TauT family transport system permease protein